MPTATMAGAQGEPMKVLAELIKLDYDAIEAYEAAIERLESVECKHMLSSFRDDHIRHTQSLGALMRVVGHRPPTGPDAKRVLTKGKVVLANVLGDKAILQAMKSNEEQANTAYENATRRDGVTAQMMMVIRENLEDERRHRAWIEHKITTL